MHILIGFLIIVAFAGGFWKPVAPQKGQMAVAAADAPQATVRPVVQPLSELQYGHLVRQMYDYSCGSAALATMLRYFLGEDLDERQVIQGLLTYGDRARIAQRRAFSLLDMKRYLAALGYKAAGYKAQVADLRTLGQPAIVPIEIFGYRHFAVLRGVHGDHVFLADPWRGNLSFALADFEQRWYHKVVFLIHADHDQTRPLLALGEEDLRYIDEDRGRKIVFHARDMGGLDEFRWRHSGPGLLDDYRR